MRQQRVLPRLAECGNIPVRMFFPRPSYRILGILPSLLLVLALVTSGVRLPSDPLHPQRPKPTRRAVVETPLKSFESAAKKAAASPAVLPSAVVVIPPAFTTLHLAVAVASPLRAAYFPHPSRGPPPVEA